MMIKFNKINSKKIVVVMLSCFVLLQTGCTKKEAAASQKEYMRNSKIEQSVQNLNDEIEISINNRSLNLLVEEKVLEERRKKWVPKPQKIKSGYLAKYARTVQDASHGAIV